MDLSKYLHMLTTETLWFSRADRLGDRFEGSMSQANIRLRPVVYGDRIPAPALLRMQEIRRQAVRHHFISCWHCNEWESAAMWQLYMRDHGIAIVTTYERLRSALGGEDDVFVGFVRYVDYDNDWIAEGNSFSPFMHKRRSFEHEREVRAVIARYPTRPDPSAEGGKVVDLSLPSPDGLRVPVSLSALLVEVRVAPDAPSWFADVVEEATRRYGLEIVVSQSDLGGDPVY